MQVYTEIHEAQNFTPEYLPEVAPTPFSIDKEVITRYSKLNWFRRFLALPKVSKYVLESLDKSNEFSGELYRSVKQTDRRVDNLEEKFSTLRGLQGDFQILQAKFNRIEQNENEITILKSQILGLKRKSAFMMLIMILSLVANIAVFMGSK